MNDAPRAPHRAGGSSSNPLATWRNDDLLIDPDTRRIVAEASPRAFRVLDWPALREEFERRNAVANRAKLSVNRHGVRGAQLSAIGASLLALEPLLPASSVRSVVVVVGCGVVLIGGLMGLWHLLGHGGRSRWLSARLWTERLRQFYFQYLINDLPAALAAMEDDDALAAYRASSDGALGAFIDDIERNFSARSFDDAILWLADDHDDSRMWGRDAWGLCRIPPGMTATADYLELFECLLRGRIGIQEAYAWSNLKTNTSSQGGMARRVALRGNIATVLFVIFLALAGVSALNGGAQASLGADALIALSGVAAAWGLYFRLVDQGMGYALDADRYALYVEQIGLVRQRFDAAGDDVHGKVSALRQLEIYTYRELRQFLRTHLKSRFL